MSGFASADLAMSGEERRKDVKRRQAKKLRHLSPSPLFDEKEQKQTFTWIQRPAEGNTLHSEKQYADAINDYFEDCVEAEIQPRLTGLALALGLGGPTSLYRLPRRRPELRHVITRAITAISYGYESQINGGNATGALYMLKHLPDFDDLDPDGSAPTQHFTDKQEIVLEAHAVVGAVNPNEEGSDLSPAEAYMQVIHGGEVIEISAEREEKRQRRKEKRWAADFTFEEAVKELHATVPGQKDAALYFPQKATPKSED